MFVATDNKVSTINLIVALENEVESPWATYNRGKPITPRQLSKLLSAYSISSKTVRFGHSNTLKGYDLSQFTDAFARYLAPSELPLQGNNALEANNGEDSSVTDDQIQLIPRAEMPSALDEVF